MKPEANNLVGRTVVLTGASGGIGTYITHALIKADAKVVGIARSQQKLTHLQTDIRKSGSKSGGEFIALPFDLSQIDTLGELLTQIRQRVGAIDVLINNAGIERYRAFQDYTTADLQEILTINLVAAMELSRLVLPDMLKRDTGHIINIASLAAKKGHPYDSVYSASKAGLFMWSDALRQELAETPVQVSVICPGYVSEVGMMADTGIPAPALAGVSPPQKVAEVVVRSIQKQPIEVIFNQDSFNSALTKVLLSLWQLFPAFGDTIYRLVGVDRVNKTRASK